jgi:hypothetical protein
MNITQGQNYFARSVVRCAMDMDTGPNQSRGRGASIALCLAMAVVVKTAMSVMQRES